jgi:hypothetical protein
LRRRAPGVETSGARVFRPDEQRFRRSRRAFERARIGGLLRDDGRVRIGERESFNEVRVLGVVDAVVEQRAGRELRGIDDQRDAITFWFAAARLGGLVCPIA